ncbi:peptidoglycan recognition protein family protein [Hoyosella altamirensis]|uniref:N-acetylmuramoyl-L-alanine amidase n=1 Tax=Hoyosella altamirensis TaxID=616997 RepID=A0A839RRG4_9ACTN|nr:N-acetylmuramoyl-L-alanine amidase [Hoyosella altamirensis]MBB3038947.1 hypothetical protein [Hoyosella altamirensis]
MHMHWDGQCRREALVAWIGNLWWLADALREEGLQVVEQPGWRQRGHGEYRDIRGVMCHHTAGGGPNDWQVVLNGRPDLPGPLSNLVLEKDGTYRVIASGVCWHAGRGSWPGWPTDNANWHVIGIEAVSRGVPDAQGRYDWTPEQLDAYVRGCAVLARRAGFPVRNVVGHKEYSSEGKIDPAGIDMNDFRAQVQQVVNRMNAPRSPDEYPLPEGYYFGPLEGPVQSISGLHPSERPEWREALKHWQRAQLIPDTGTWDDATAAAARAVQAESGWNPDGLIGPGTWAAGLRGPAAPPAGPEEPILEEVAPEIPEGPAEPDSEVPAPTEPQPPVATPRTVLREALQWIRDRLPVGR